MGSLSTNKKPGIVFLIFGIVLPATTLIAELTTNMCAEGFFDPLPTPLHVLLVALVPIANLAVWLVGRGRLAEWSKTISLLNGCAIGISAYYSALFMPLAPSALVGILLGIGLFPLSPFFALAAAIKARLFLRSQYAASTEARLYGVWVGIVASILAIVLAEAAGTATRLGIRMAASPDKEERLAGLRFLRTFGVDNLLLRACCQRGITTDWISGLILRRDPIPPSKAREVYYLVTGRSFDSAPTPRLTSIRPYHRERFDRDVGTRMISSQIEGLSLETSRLDASIDPDAALGYLQWTMEFRNQSSAQQEARAQIQLPHGSVVSRLTLWVDGEEREAAFAKRAQVTKAYREVVRARRDPVLVTTHGPDRILMQCFPVEPRGGALRIRLGISVPLQLAGKEAAVLRFPCILERNFKIDSAHLVWIEAKQKLTAKIPTLTPENPGPGVFALRGPVSDDELADPIKATVIADRNAAVIKAWTEDLIPGSGNAVIQTIKEQPMAVPQKLILVIDGSASMNDFRGQIGDAVRAISDKIHTRILVASDEVTDFSDAVQKIAEMRFQGGCDNIPALAKAWDLAATEGDSAIVWIHGPQPVLIEPVETLKQKWERRPGGPTLFAIQAVSGPNRIINELDCVSAFRPVPRSGSLTEDIKKLFAALQGEYARTILQREKIGMTEFRPDGDFKHTSGHLARLWAYEEALKLCASKQPDADRQAIELATSYQLVTPKTGAVVLETSEQFKRHGLTPAKATDVPTIPEPEFWMLMAVIVAALLIAGYRRRIWSVS
jgi:hypothetical protein